MPDFSQFVRHFNSSLPAPTTNCYPLALAVAGDTPTPSLTVAEASTLVRLADSTWRLLTASDAVTKDGGKSTAAATEGNTPSSVSITVGRMTVSTEDRWRIHAQLRREEAKSGLARREYNKKVTRAIKVTKGPSGDEFPGFPAGRGRPL